MVNEWKIMNKRSILAVLIFIILSLVAVALFFSLQSNSQNSAPQGTSSFPALDIVAGDITAQDTTSTLSYLSALSGETILPTDVTIRTGSYQKSYADDHNGYIVNFIADIHKVKSSYDISIQYIDKNSLGVVARCSDKQLSGYACVDKATITEGE